jgi:DMSO/TMAO reductase YedYZ molybdopterin-dependent catalytic subunit
MDDKDQSIQLTNHLTDRDLRRMSRRELLKLTPILAVGALALPPFNERLLKTGLQLTDRGSQGFFNRNRLARTFSDAEVTPIEKFPVNSYSDYNPENDLVGWTLTVEGMVARPGEYSLDQIKSLPRQRQNVEHICIEGWHVIGDFGGARLCDFLQFVGANPAARFVEVNCLDDYYSSYDIESCLHPQTLLCYEMYGQPLSAAHGAPLRVHMPVKLGYKSAKHIYSIRVSDALGKQKGFWEDQGYSWHGGI